MTDCFGIGHAIQGRWKERGWIHTTLQSVITVVFIGILISGGVNLFADPPPPRGDFILGRGDPKGLDLSYVGLSAGTVLIMFGSKIWESIDVWILPDSIKIISQKQKFHTSPSSLYSQQYKTKMPHSVALQWQF